MKKIFPILMLSFLIFSCNEEAPKTDEVNSEVKTEENCSFTVIAEELKFEWTAFKTTEKIAVKGTFDEINASNEGEASSLPEAIANTNFEIFLGSINSNNEERDEKLIEFVFGNMENSEKFEGIVEECDGDNKNGSLIVNLSMNNVSKQVKMKYGVTKDEAGNDMIHIKGTLDLLDWEAGKSLDAINVACLDLHKGADGVSKTWSNMEINVKVPIKITCE